MPIEARIDQSHDSFVRNRVRVVAFGSGTAEGPQVFEQRIDYELNSIADNWVPADSGPARRDGYPPYVLDVPEYIAQAVYAALKARYEPEDDRVSADAHLIVYEALDKDRDRLDKALDALINIATGVAAP